MRLPKSLAARIGAVAITAAVAVTGATVAANAATAAPASHATAAHVTKIPTALGITNSMPKAHPYGTTAIINGHLTAGTYNLRHLRIWLQRQGRWGHWYTVQMKLTKRFGHVFFRVYVGKRAVNFRLVFRGTHNFARSVSAVDTIAPTSAV